MSKAAGHFLAIALPLTAIVIILSWPVGRSASRADATDGSPRPRTPLLAATDASLLPLGAPEPAMEPLLPPAGANAAAAELLAPRTVTYRMLVTAYCPCAKCCGKHADGRTACGLPITANGSVFVAADTKLLPFHTRVSIPGYNADGPVEVLDRGGRIKGYRLDVFFLDHKTATKWGKQWLDVAVYAD